MKVLERSQQISDCKSMQIFYNAQGKLTPQSEFGSTLKGEFQICPRMDFDNILCVEYLRYNNYKNEIISFLGRLLGHRGAP